MQFDDGVETILRLAEDCSGPAQTAVFRQLIDMLIQQRVTPDDRRYERVLDALHQARPATDALTRREMAALVTRYAADQVDLVALFLDEDPTVLAPLLLAARLPDTAWEDIAWCAPPRARAIMAARTGLPARVRRFLTRFGPAVPMLEDGRPSAGRLPDVHDAGALACQPADTAARVSSGPVQPVAEPATATPTSPDVVPPDQPPATDDDAQVRRLIDRIEAYRARMAMPAVGGAPVSMDVDAAPQARPEEDTRQVIPWPGRPRASETPAVAANDTGLPLPPRPERMFRDLASSVADWRWETDRLSVLRYVDGLSSSDEAELVGQSLLSLAVAAGAALEGPMRRRVPFRDIRVRIAEGAAQGRWLFAGVPYFDRTTGQYLGYRGTATAVLQRPAAVSRSSVSDTQEAEATAQESLLAGEALSTMAHEVRTPLNAIMGFAQMIESETVGPVPEPYRKRASGIITEAEQLMGAIDSVQDTTRLKRGSYQLLDELFNPAELVQSLVDAHQEQAHRRGVYLVSRIGGAVPPMRGDPHFIKRALGRLLVLAAAGAHPGETVVTGLKALPGGDIAFQVQRPDAARAPMPDAMLSTRLIDRLAAAMGGRLEVSAGVFQLVVPPAPDSARQRSHQVS